MTKFSAKDKKAESQEREVVFENTQLNKASKDPLPGVITATDSGSLMPKTSKKNSVE